MVLGSELLVSRLEILPKIGCFPRRRRFELYYDNSKKFETTGSGTTTYGTALTQQLNVTGVSTFTGNVSFGSSCLSRCDLDKLKFGYIMVDL